MDCTALQHRYEELFSELTGFVDVYSDVSRLFAPGRYRDRTATDYHLRPYPIDSKLVNPAGILALRTLASGLHGGMTSPARPWFRLIPKNNKTQGVNAWLDEVTLSMHSVLHLSNFYAAVHGLYADLGAFGTGLMIETADEDGIHFHLCNPGEFAIDINGNGEVDTFYRRLYMTARQIVDRFDPQNIPEFIKRNGTTKNATARYDVVHAVFPRQDFNGSKISTKKRFASVYFMPGGKGALEEGGYDSFPGFAPRWEISGSDRYGISPAMQVLPDIRMLQVMTTTLRKMQHKIADPPLVVDQSLRATGVRLNPGGLSYFDSTRAGTNPVSPIHMPEAQSLHYTSQTIRDVEETVSRGLYADLFSMFIDEKRSGLTATEISARQSEKLVLLGPVVERLHKELLEPVIQRTFQLMRDWGALPELPENVELEIDVAFESVLAQAQKATLGSQIEQALMFAGNVAQMAPDTLDLIDTDETLRAYLARIAAPISMLREDTEVQNIRRERQQQRENEQQIATGQQALAEAGQLADAAETLSKTKMDSDTLLGGLIG